MFSFIKHLRDWPCSKSKLPKGHSLVWSLCFLPVCSQLFCIESQIVFTAQAFFPILSPFSVGGSPSLSLSISEVAPCSDQFSQELLMLLAKRNQWRRKEPSVSRYLWFPLSHSFPCGMVKLSLIISIQTALLIASFEKMEQSGPFSLPLHYWWFRQGSMEQCNTGFPIIILSTSVSMIHQINSVIQKRNVAARICFLFLFFFSNQHFYLFIYFAWLFMQVPCRSLHVLSVLKSLKTWY